MTCSCAYHEFLVGLVRVNIAVRNVAHLHAGAKGAHRTTAAPITVNRFDQYILRWRFHGHALILRSH